LTGTTTQPQQIGDPELAALVAQLDPRQRAALTAGASGWSTLPAAEIGLEPMLMGDGPLGLVSPTFDERETSLLLPCGTALAASWDVDVVRSVGAAVGSEAARRGFAAVYSPNLNLPRTGLSGRSFEMYSEDPYLTGALGAAFVIGLQGQGVAACPKHLVCNDTETERQRMSATVDEVSLREVYLRPFEMAVRAGAQMLMTAYNGLNGVPCTEHAELLAIVKDEWGFDGPVLSDYFALKQTLAPALAGLDLEMPGPAIHLGERLADEVTAGNVPQQRVDDAVARLLRLARRVGALPRTERIVLDPAGAVPADAAHGLLAAAAAASFTLVRNEGALLPLAPERLTRLAVIGPNAIRPTYQGATFGRVRPAEAVATPAQALQARFGGSCEVVVEPGTAAGRGEVLSAFSVTTPDGRPGMLLEHFRDASGKAPVLTEVRADSAFVWFGSVPGVGPTTEPGRVRLTTVLTVETSGSYALGVGGSGEATLSVDGTPLVTRPAPAPGDVMGQVARAETTAGTVGLTAGVPVTVVAELRSAGARVLALTVDCLRPQPSGALERAVRAAGDADAVVLVVGDELTTSRESRDLETTSLPDSQVALIRAVAAVNPRVVVVLNAGRPVSAPWAEEVAAVLYAWLPGQGFGDALAAVLAGDLEPSGRMPVTVTRRDEDRSTWGQTLDDDLALDYTVSEPVGYRHLQRTGVAPRFALGDGLGYTTWRLGTPRLADVGRLVVPVTNTGDRAGREVVQAYVRAPGEPDARLAGFAGVHVEPGETAQVTVVLDDRAFSRWDAGSRSWRVVPGTHEVLVGRSSVDLPYVLPAAR
jgi:beta-glucosidase